MCLPMLDPGLAHLRDAMLQLRYHRQGIRVVHFKFTTLLALFGTIVVVVPGCN